MEELSHVNNYFEYIHSPLKTTNAKNKTNATLPSKKQESSIKSVIFILNEMVCFLRLVLALCQGESDLLVGFDCNYVC